MLTKTRIGGALLLVFCLTYWWLIRDIRLLPFQVNQAFTARTIPELLAIIGSGLAVLCLILPGSGEKPDLKGLDWPRVIGFLVLMSAYGLLIRPLGFLLSTTAFLMIGFTMLGERRIWISAAVAVPLVVGFWVLMTQGLDVYIAPLPAALN
ncbi:tripartite tricarboxylate transporter TctB family protein [Jannaschia aquimarina]|uniref:Tripartite tricarboxylate transporter TctB family protein n=1 Tax=Jannaschia aquimarina TaxID=935700 RepID=A0A0D1EFE0_9RHOB|nr:tripartite tricarboxylate transporter TctB family protein [Jannaschia aquimarina]KIT16314.1 Tripartite tricarboxylate transporter TctB family protein [Jannaschia aquimarina]SNT26348.1 putative tricarboxylic transport membrane protein [Jannaschia aquimarina]